MGRAEGSLHTVITLVLDAGRWSPSRPGRYTPEERPPISIGWEYTDSCRGPKSNYLASEVCDAFLFRSGLLDTMDGYDDCCFTFIMGLFYSHLCLVVLEYAISVSGLFSFMPGGTGIRDTHIGIILIHAWWYWNTRCMYRHCSLFCLVVLEI
jgi:hypothetical protein